MLLSQLPEASALPSGLNATEVTKHAHDPSSHAAVVSVEQIPVMVQQARLTPHSAKALLGLFGDHSDASLISIVGGQVIVFASLHICGSNG